MKVAKWRVVVQEVFTFAGGASAHPSPLSETLNPTPKATTKTRPAAHWEMYS